MSKVITMKCPHCGTMVQGKTGFMSKTFKCGNCKKEIDPEKDSFEAVICAHCGNDVMFDTRMGLNQRCPVCGQPMNDHSIPDMEVVCPFCHMQPRVKFNETKHTCPFCAQVFDVQQAKSLKMAENASAPVEITVPAGNQYTIWKHPIKKFGFASQVIVPEGYTGLILRDGVCSSPSQPGRYILSDSIRSMSEQLEHAVLDQTAQVSVQIIFVRKQIDKQFNWSGQKVSITNQIGESIGTIGFGGNISLHVIDAKRLAEYVGYESAMPDELIVSGTVNGNGSKLYEKVRSCCFESAEMVLKSDVYSNRVAPESLDSNRSVYSQNIQPLVDEKLAEIGLKTSLFSLDFCTFQEAEKLVLSRNEDEKKKKNRADICRFAENTFEWEAPEIPLHMKDDQTLSAKIVYAGTMKFRIRDKELFFRNTQVDHWITEGMSESIVKEHFSGLAKLGSSTVISDLMQQMVNDTNADIRDLNTYYRYVREKIRDRLSSFFSKDGLEVELFDMHQKSCSLSQALRMKTEGETLGATGRIRKDIRIDQEQLAAEEHKNIENIHADTYAFDSDLRIKKENINSNERIASDTIQVKEDQIMTEHYNAKTINELKRAEIDHQAKTQREAMERANEQSDRDYLHYVEDSEVEWLRRKEKETEKYLHEKKMTDYIYQSEESAAESSIEVQKVKQETDVRGAQHHQMKQDLYEKTQEQQILHYMDQQEVESRAKMLHASWEAERSEEDERLQHQLKMDRMQWDENLLRNKEQAALNLGLEQSSAQNERIINDIMVKIAESNLNLKQKKDAYERLLRNQDADDSLRHTVESTNANIALTYESEHLKNILTQEELEYMNDLAERSADFEEKISDRRSAREEAIKNADYVREMKRQEIDTAHQMELLKLKYERDERQAVREHEIRLKDIEINELKTQLTHYEHMGDQDIQKMNIRTNAETTVRTSEIGAWESIENARSNNASEKAKTDRQYEESREQAQRDSEERLAQARMKLENDYMKRADDLMTQILSIQASMKKMDSENERSAVQADAEVQIAWAKANADIAKYEKDSNVSKIMKDTEKILGELQKARRSLEAGKRAVQRNTVRDYPEKNGAYDYLGKYGTPTAVPPVSGLNAYSAPAGGIASGNSRASTYGQGFGYNGAMDDSGPAGTSGVQYGMPAGQPGTKKCPVCGKTHSAYITICTCGTRLG